MSAAVAQLLDHLTHLSAAEKLEFLSLVSAPATKASDEITDDDLSLIAAQTFARLDAEEEAYASTRS